MQQFLQDKVLHPEAEQLRQFWQRMQAARAQQYRPKITEVFEDPITGRRCTLAPGRTHRHVETKPN